MLKKRFFYNYMIFNFSRYVFENFQTKERKENEVFTYPEIRLRELLLDTKARKHLNFNEHIKRISKSASR